MEVDSGALEVPISRAERRRLHGAARALRYGFCASGCSGAAPCDYVRSSAPLAPLRSPSTSAWSAQLPPRNRTRRARNIPALARPASAGAHAPPPPPVHFYDAVDLSEGMPILINAINALVTRIAALEANPVSSDHALALRIAALENQFGGAADHVELSSLLQLVGFPIPPANADPPSPEDSVSTASSVRTSKAASTRLPTSPSACS